MVNKFLHIKLLSKYGYIVLFLLIAVFFCFYYNYHLLYTEQLQLFQFSGLYFESLINKPGGLSNYLGTFLTQFYAWNHTGGLLITFILWLLFFVQKRIARSWCIKIADVFLLFPTLIFTLFFMDVNAQIGGALAVLIAILFAWAVSLLSRDWIRYSIALLFIPMVYGATGGGLFVYTSLLIVYELLRSKKNIYFIAAFILLSITLPLYVRQYLIPLSWNNTWFGTSFYRSNNMSDLIWYLIFSPTVTYLIAGWGSRIINGYRRSRQISFLLIICMLVGSAILIYHKQNKREEALYTLDYLLKNKKWEEMIEVTDRQPYHNAIFVSYTNLALLNLGKLPDKMMNYSQRPDINEFWTSSYLPMFLTGETYYNLGMYDAARAYLYMANTQSPSGQSPYMFQQLAELEIIRGNYVSGMKYIQTLKQTLYYRKWAIEMEQAVQSGIYPNHLQIPMKQYKENNSFLAKEMLYNVTCKHKEEPNNTKVLDFLLARFILTNDYKGFIHCVSNLPNGIGREFPRTYQEFLLMYAYMVRDNTLIEKWHISQNVVTDFYQYLQINQSGQSADVIKKKLSENYRRSYWYYVQYTNEF